MVSHVISSQPSPCTFIGLILTQPSQQPRVYPRPDLHCALDVRCSTSCLPFVFLLFESFSPCLQRSKNTSSYGSRPTCFDSVTHRIKSCGVTCCWVLTYQPSRQFGMMRQTAAGVGILVQPSVPPTHGRCQPPTILSSLSTSRHANVLHSVTHYPSLHCRWWLHL